MTLWLLVVAVIAGLLSTLRPYAPGHWVLGVVSLGALTATLAALPSMDGDFWLVGMATVISIALNAFGAVMLLFRRHPRRRHRHIIYGGYGLVFAIIALCWAVAERFPGSRADLLASIASVSAYVIGSLAILVYKARQTRDLTRSS